MAFGEDCLLCRVCGKIFACIGLTGNDYFVLKADADEAVALRERYPEIQPAWHWNKKYWIQLSLNGSLTDDFIKSLIRASFAEVVKKFTRKFKNEHPELLEIN